MAKASPQAMARAIRCTKGSTPPQPKAVGTKPASVVIALVQIGRKRVSPAFRHAFLMDIPAARFLLIKLTKTMG